MVTSRPRAVVIGPPGSGKSTIGALLARRLDLPFHDTDAAIVAAEGRSISDIFVDDGEPRFRELERSEVARALEQESGVVSVGGGAPMDEQTQARLVGHTVVFLEVGIADAAKRVGFDTSRPLLVVNPRQQWVKMNNERHSTYSRLARIRINTAGRTPADIVDEVLTDLGDIEASIGEPGA